MNNSKIKIIIIISLLLITSCTTFPIIDELPSDKIIDISTEFDANLCLKLKENNTSIMMKNTKRVIIPYEDETIEVNNLLCLIYLESRHIICAIQ